MDSWGTAVINTSLIYVLKNSFKVATKILAVSGPDGSLSMVDTENVTSNSLWFLTPTHTAHQYRLHTIANGVQQSLDVINDKGKKSTGLHMTKTGDDSGQYWQFVNLPAEPQYPYRLSNVFTGPNMYLDVHSKTLVAYLSGGNHSGQYWSLTPANTVVVTTSY